MTSFLTYRGHRAFFSFLFLFSVIYSALAEDDVLNSTDDRDLPQTLRLSDVISMGTVRAVAADNQLRHTYMALVSMLSDTTREAANRYGATELTMLADDLDTHLKTVNANTEESYRLDLRRTTSGNDEDLGKRAGLLGGLFSGFLGGNKGGNKGGNGNTGANDNAGEETGATNGGTNDSTGTTGNADDNSGGAKASGLGGLLGGLFGGGAKGAAGGNKGGGPISGLIGNVASNVFSGLLSKTGSGLAGAGFFGGVGAGEGAAQGLSLAPAAKTKTTGEQVAQENGMKNTGLNPIIQNAAMGLTATAVKAVMGSNLLKLPPLGALGTALGSGIGNGGAMGLGLTQKNLAPPMNGSGIEAAVGGFGFGASRALTSNLNTTGGLASFLPPINVGAAAADVGSGIGKGAALGLKLTNNTAIAPPVPSSNSDIPGIAGTLAFGVSNGLTGSIDMQSLGNLVPGNLDIGGAALSVGTGLGSGAASGLKLVTQNKNLAPPPPKSMSDIPGIAGTLAFGLSNSFTDNINVSTKSLASMLPPIDFGAAALDVGNGIGSGAALGLKLTNNDTFVPPPPGSPLNIPKVAGTLAFGLSRSLTGAVNVSSLAGAIPGNIDIGGAALSVGTGLGSGAARGLKLTKNNISPPPAPKSMQDIPGIAGTLAFGLSNSLTDNVNISAMSLGSMLPPIDFTSAALNVGNGIGKGAALGLKLTQNNDTGFIMQAAAPGAPPDIPKIAGTLAFGLSKSLTESVNTSNVGVGNLIPANFDIGGTVLGAGRGLGGGASLGLGLSSNKTFTPPVAKSQSDIPGLAEMFTFGLSDSFTNKINLTSQTQNLGSMLPPIDFGATALNAGAGLGLGAAKGLRLTNNNVAPPPPPTKLNDVPGIAGSFAFGLSDAVTGNLNTSDLFSKFSSGANGLFSGGINGLVTKFGAPAASGLGKGLGKGAAVGLGLQPESPPEPVQSSVNGGVDIAGLTESFSEGLSSRFLANGTVTKALNSFTGGKGLSSLASAVDIPRVANGLMRGLLTGAGDGVEAIGGINAIINGTSKAPTAPIPDTKIDFNDSVGGAAVGFGEGLGSSGVVTIQKLFAKGIDLGPLLSGNSNKTKRDVEGPTKDLVLIGREDAGVAAPSGLNLSNLLSASSISVVAQKGVDVLTCDGVAGALLVANGLQKSGTISLGGGSMSANLQNALKALIPKGTIHIVSQGNTFDIDGQQLGDSLSSGGGLTQTLTINGSSFATFFAFLVIHSKWNNLVCRMFPPPTDEF